MVRRDEMAETILDRAQNATVSIDESGHVTYWNASAERMFAISGQQAIGKELAQLTVPARFRDAHRAGLRRVIDGARLR